MLIIEMVYDGIHPKPKAFMRLILKSLTKEKAHSVAFIPGKTAYKEQNGLTVAALRRQPEICCALKNANDVFTV